MTVGTTSEAASRTATLHLALSIIVMAAAIFRLALADHSLWFDEQASVFFSDQPLSRLWSDWIRRETNPPLYYSLLKIWRYVLGSSDYAIRALSVVASVAAILVLAMISHKLYGKSAAIIAAIFAALSSQHLYFATQARAYIFVYLCVLLSIEALTYFFKARSVNGTRYLALGIFVLACTAAIHLHTTMLLFPGLILLTLIAANLRASLRNPYWLIPIVGATLLTYVLSGWTIRIAVLQLLYESSNIAPIGIVGFDRIARISIRIISLCAHDVRLSLLLFGVNTVIIGWFAWRRRSCETRLLVLLALLSLFIFALIGTQVPIFVPRTIFWISAPIVILLAGAIASVRRQAIRVAACSLLGFCMTVDTIKLMPVLEQEDWRTPVEVVSRVPGAVLLVQGEAMAVLADGTCRRMKAEICPYPVIAVIDPENQFDSWARGSFSGTKAGVDALPQLVGSRPVFFFRKTHGHNLPDLLHRQGMGSGVPSNAPPLIGPFNAAALR